MNSSICFILFLREFLIEEDLRTSLMYFAELTWTKVVLSLLHAQKFQVLGSSWLWVDCNGALRRLCWEDWIVLFKRDQNFNGSARGIGDASFTGRIHLGVECFLWLRRYDHRAISRLIFDQFSSGFLTSTHCRDDLRRWLARIFCLDMP